LGCPPAPSRARRQSPAWIAARSAGVSSHAGCNVSNRVSRAVGSDMGRPSWGLIKGPAGVSIAVSGLAYVMAG
jgi:hypothetical protein